MLVIPKIKEHIRHSEFYWMEFYDSIVYYSRFLKLKKLFPKISDQKFAIAASAKKKLFGD